MKWMNMLALLIMLSCAAAKAQNVTISVKDAPIEKVFAEIRKQTGFNFVYNDEVVQRSHPVTLKVKNMAVEEAIERTLRDQPLRYQIVAKTVAVSYMPKTNSGAAATVEDSSVSLISVSGRITDSSGAAMEGATVILKGSQRMTVADDRGYFEMKNINPQDVLMVEMIGQERESFPVNGKTSLSLVLSRRKISVLNEVLVTGYQSFARTNSTIASSVVDNKELNRKINPDVLSSLEGKIPGLSTFRNNMVVRGQSSFSVGSRPLLVIDGLPTENASLGSSDNVASLSKNTLSAFVNPNDIESITLLKDAAATSIYGARAANGVLVITTKSGKSLGKNKTSIQFSADMILTEKPSLDYMNYASTGDIINYEKDIYSRNLVNYSNGATGLFEALGYIGSTTNISYYSPLYNLYRQMNEGTITQKQFDDQVASMSTYDYRRQFAEEAWRNPFRQSYNLSVGTSGEKQDIYVSMNYIGQTERMISNSGETFNLYLKARQRITKGVNFTIGTNAQMSHSKMVNDADYESPTAFVEPYTQMLDENGNRVYRNYVNKQDGTGGTAGPFMNAKTVEQIGQINALKANRLKSASFNLIDELENDQSRTERFGLRSFADLSVQVMHGLNLSSSFQYELGHNKTEFLWPEESYKMRYLVNRMANNTGNPFTTPNTFLYPISETGGRLQQSYSSNNSYTWRNQANFNRKIATDHHLSAIAGTEIRQTYTPKIVEKVYYGYNPVTLAYKPYDELMLQNTGVTSFVWSRASVMRLSSPTSLGSVKHRYFSLYSNFNYTFRNTYTLAASVRVDQADLFGTDPKYRYRPLWSVSGSWNLNNESFMKNIRWIDMLKLRASYGLTGNVDQNSSPYILANGGTNPSYEPLLTYNAIFTAPNPLLRWEKTATINAGIDFGIFDNKLRGSIDVYSKNSEDLLATKTLDPTNGFTSARINNGAMTNKGIEVGLTGDWYRTKDLVLSSLATFAYNKNNVTRIDATPTTASQLVANNGYYLTGNPLAAIYAYQYAGLSSGGTTEQNGIPLFYLDAAGKTENVVNNGTGTTISQVTNPAALRYMGSAVPVWNASFQQSIAYKGFELTGLFIMYGGYKVRKDVVSLYHLSTGGGAIHKDIVNRWTADNQATDIPKTYPSYSIAQGASVIYLDSYWKQADAQVIDANFIRLRNLTLAYNIAPAALKKLHLQNARLSTQVNNAWYLFSGGYEIDADTFDGRSGTRSYATPVSFLFRLDVTF